MDGLMIFLEHNGSSSPSFLRRRLATPVGSQSSLSLMDIDHTFLKNFISLQWPTTSIYFAFHPIPPIAYNLSMLESSDHWEMLSLNTVMRFSRRLEKRFQFRTLSRSTCTHVPMHSNLRPSKKLSRIVESVLLTLTSLQMWTMLQAYHPWYMLMPCLLTQRCWLCLHNKITPPMMIQIMTQTLNDSDHDSNPDESDNDQTDNEQPNTPNLAEQHMDPTPSTCTVERPTPTSQCEPIHHSPSIAGPAAQPFPKFWRLVTI